MPTSREGTRSLAAIAVTEIDEVLVARMQSSPTMLFQLGEQRALDVQVLDDGFHHQPGAGNLVERDGGMQAGDGGGAVDRAHAALEHQLVQGCAMSAMALATASGRVSNSLHGVAGDGGHLRDAGAHGAAADDGDRAPGVESGHVILP
jgi:hypothetical protein